MNRFGDQVTVIEDNFEGEDFVVAGHGSDNFVVSFTRDPGDGSLLSFIPVQDKYPVIMTDQEGNMWDITGTAVSGPREGLQLEHAQSFMGYWFSFPAFYPSVSVYGES